MADQDEHKCTDEQHEAMSEIAGEAIGQAFQTCVDNGVCSAVMFDEMIRALVSGAITHEYTLSDVVGDLIDEYLGMAESMKAVKQALRKAEKAGSLS